MKGGAMVLASGMDLREMGSMMCASGFFADTREAAQAAVKIQAGAELGFPPVASMVGVYIVKGKVSLSANLMAAAIKRFDGGKYNYRVRQHTPEACEIEFYERGESVGLSTFTIADARRAGTQNLDKYARNMLFARAMSNGAKWFCPDVFGGPVYTPEEMGEPVNEDGEIVTTTATPTLPPPAQRETPALPEANTNGNGKATPAGPKVQLMETVKAWSGFATEDLPGAVRSCAAAAGVEINGKMTNQQAEYVQAWVDEQRAAGARFMDATAKDNKPIDVGDLLKPSGSPA